MRWLLYAMGGIAIWKAVAELLEMWERYLSQDARDHWALLLWEARPTAPVRPFPDAVRAAFETAFGRRHWSLICFWRSAIVSSVVVVLVSLAWLIRPSVSQVITLPDGRWALATPSGDSAPWVLAVPIALALSIPFDYLALFLTRWLMARLTSPNLRTIVFYAVANIVAVTLLFFALFDALGWTLLTLLVPESLPRWDSTLATLPHALSDFLHLIRIPGMTLWTCYVTSVWLWAYLVAVGLLRLLQGAEWLLRISDIEHHPLRVVGTLAGGVCACAWWVYSLLLWQFQ